MMNEMREQAKQLADRPYSVRVMRDETTEGQPILLALNPELPHCMAQGQTIKEAIENLEYARLEYILSLLEDRLEVPEPIVLLTTTNSSDGVIELIQEDVAASEERGFLVFEASREPDFLIPAPS